MHANSFHTWQIAAQHKWFPVEQSKTKNPETENEPGVTIVVQ